MAAVIHCRVPHPHPPTANPTTRARHGRVTMKRMDPVSPRVRSTRVDRSRWRRPHRRVIDRNSHQPTSRTQSTHTTTHLTLTSMQIRQIRRLGRASCSCRRRAPPQSTRMRTSICTMIRCRPKSSIAYSMRRRSRTMVAWEHYSNENPSKTRMRTSRRLLHVMPQFAKIFTYIFQLFNQTAICRVAIG